MTAEEKAIEYTDNEFAILPKSMAKEDMRHRAQKDFEAGYNEAMRCQSSPKIKQLEWMVGEGTETRLANIPFNSYYIIDGVDGIIFLTINIQYHIGRYATIDEAKAAAQADFERRVMECLDM